MSSYKIEKIPGGSKFTRDADANKTYIVHSNSGDKIRPEVFGGIYTIEVTDRFTYKINPVTDTLIIDETAVGGSVHTYNPNSLTADQMASNISSVFNPFANLIMT